LFEQSEFLPPPRYSALRGEPKAKLLGSLSLVCFFGLNKEMNEQFFEIFWIPDCDGMTNSKRNAMNELFPLA
jgi:hypothetical protein